MTVELTDAEILCLHKWMWSDMQKELGDSPGSHARTEFKFDWCMEHDLDICYNCFLCECVAQNSKDFMRDCNICLVEWPMLGDENFIIKNCYFNGFYLWADISDILKLPAKELDPDRRTRIDMCEWDVEELKRRMEEGE